VIKYFSYLACRNLDIGEFFKMKRANYPFSLPWREGVRGRGISEADRT
jgi:hypothetical protein